VRNFRVWLGFFGSLVFLYFAFRGQDFQRIWEALRQANYWYVLPGLGLYFAGVWVRSLRWAFLLRPVQRLSGRGLFRIVVVGYTANNVLPFRAGEFVRAYVLSSREDVKKSSALATIAVERIFDGLTMLLFILIASVTIALTAQLQNLAIVAALLFGGLLVVMAVVVSERPREWLLGSLLPLLPRRLHGPAHHVTHSFLAGLGILRQREDLLLVSLTSIAAWMLEASMYAVISLGFGLGLSPSAVLLVTAVANLATLIPSSPGYIGPFEAGVLLALVGALGIERELALSYAVVVHAALYFPITLWGLFYWWRESLSWREVRKGLSAEEMGD
jgi:uncharacterized protein (TIRG00374 family)